MAEAVVRLGLDPSGMVAGQRVASAAIGKVGNAAVRAGQATARAGTQAGQRFGRGMVGGARQAGTEFRRVVDQAAQHAQRRLSSIRPTPIRMPAVQQAAVPAGRPCSRRPFRRLRRHAGRAAGGCAARNASAAGRLLHRRGRPSARQPRPVRRGRTAHRRRCCPRYRSGRRRCCRRCRRRRWPEPAVVAERSRRPAPRRRRPGDPDQR